MKAKIRETGEIVEVEHQQLGYGLFSDISLWCSAHKKSYSKYELIFDYNEVASSDDSKADESLLGENKKLKKRILELKKLNRVLFEQCKTLTVESLCQKEREELLFLGPA